MSGLAPHCNTKTAFLCMEIPIVKIRRSWDHLIFIMGSVTQVARHHYIDATPIYWFEIMISLQPSKSDINKPMIRSVSRALLARVNGTISRLGNDPSPIGYWDINTLRPRQNGRHFPDDIFKCIFLNENVWVSVKISLKFVARGPIKNIPALV